MKQYRSVYSTVVGLRVGSNCRHKKKECPCLSCFKWRRRTYTPRVLSQIQTQIRRVVWENLQLSRDLDKLFS